ncbi:PREDICTED: probable serine/threonine-protein kinase DDB_G0278665 isoform X2 [Bactrocera latifrons]|uniref:probable serine/threonine-protein kinase DDB_G0278665 isoform X2 n=1 Tax=Bactrocera latifrons TaxID=174628 RepID=UPI0008DE94F8|nr:PREDICTED: probable serine/threonine-protein kinase DDB_G0278665 isoform X2 [Bactrocera latifrons]
MSYLGKGCNVLPNSSDLNELIEDTSLLIASVYTMLDRTQSTPQRTASSLGRRSHNNSDSSGQLERANSNSSSPKSPKTPRLNLPARTTLSTPSSREIEQEVNRNRFCEMLERNLRTVASEQEQLVGRRLELTSPTTPPTERPQPVRTNRVRAPTPEEVIDLSDSMNMPVPIRRSYPFNDDVIVVTPDDGDVVDLCTPNFRRNNGRSRNRRTTTDVNARTGNATRQRLTASRRLSSASGHRASSRRSLTSNEGSSSVSFTSATTSTTNIGTANKDKVNEWSPGAQVASSDAGVVNESGRVPFMCAVCMESCVNNQPTSTKCGHVFCANCIRQALRLTRKCPMCNTKLSPSMLFRIYI